MTPAQEAALIVVWVWAGLLLVSHALSLWEVYGPRPTGEGRDTIAARIAAPFWAVTERLYGHERGSATQSEPWAPSEPGDRWGRPPGYVYWHELLDGE